MTGPDSTPALACQDILALIFSHLDPSKVHWEGPYDLVRSRQTCRTALVSSAVVCRILSQHALNTLWRELDDIQPLLKVLPEYKCVSAQFVGSTIPPEFDPVHSTVVVDALWRNLNGTLVQVSVLRCAGAHRYRTPINDGQDPPFRLAVSCSQMQGLSIDAPPSPSSDV